jgi:hypothetical protein
VPSLVYTPDNQVLLQVSSELTGKTPESDDHIHTTEDKIEYLSFDHMLQHAKLTLGLAYELGNTDFGGKKEHKGHKEYEL